MTINYGLRNPTTGRIIRLAENLAFHGDYSCHLSEAPELPYWKVKSFAHLVETICENRPQEQSYKNVPEWGTVSPWICQPIGFITEVGRDIEGGDPVSITERLVTFEVGFILDLRQSINRTAKINTKHYGVMQHIFARYDMDRIETMSLALVWSNGPMQVRGDIGMTHDKGPARIIDVAALPEDWQLTEEQKAYEPFPDANISLLLLDTSELESWLDFDQIDPDTRLNAAA